MSFELWQIILLGLIGICSGWINVMAGGGSLLTVPIMLFMGMPGPVANGTNRIGILFQNIFAVISFFRKGFSDFKLNLSLSICAIIGAIGGASIGIEIKGVWFNYFLSSIMIAVIIITLKKKKHNNSQEQSPLANTSKPYPNRRQLIYGHICMVGVGFWGGMIQIGVGFITMPILNRIMGFDLVRTNMYKVTIVLSYTIVALIIFAYKIEIYWLVGLIIAIGTSIGGYLGAHTSMIKGDVWIKRVLNLVLIIFIIKLLSPVIIR